MIKISIDGLRAISTVLSQYKRVVEKQRPSMFRVLGETTKKQTQKRILMEKKTSEGESWKPWAKSYAKTRGSKHSLLIDTKKMLKSLVVKASHAEGKMGTPLDYGEYNQNTRPWLGVSDDNLRDLDKELHEWFLEQVRGSHA